ncbi:MAG TPA: rod shape-determining protein MreC [Patescibacteria group bacterium]|nr:rod shape-determining protein MreC [Patescibacteria group bacterium]
MFSRQVIITFLLLLLFSFGVFFLSQKQFLGGLGFLGNAVFPLEGSLFSLSKTALKLSTDAKYQLLLTQNRQLSSQIASLKELQADNKALRDQFQTTNPAPTTLIPAAIIGAPTFLPNITFPESLIVAAGSSDGVKKGQAVVYENNLIGTITDVSSHGAKVVLITAASTSFTAKTVQTGALGVLKGTGGGEMILDNVVLSDQLQKDDSVVSDKSEPAYPSGLVVGKIISVDKKPSSLFQSASLKSLVDITRIPMVFIVKESN